MASPAFQQASLEHLRRLDRLIDRGGVARIRRVYEQAQAELERKITASIGRGAAPFTIHQYRSLLAQVRQGQMAIARRLGDAAADATTETQRDTLRALIRQIARAEAAAGGTAPTLPIEEAARFAGVIDKRKTSLLAQNRASMARYGAHLVQTMEGHLAHGLATAAPTHEVIAKLAKTANVELYRAERIVRTEQAWAANATTRDGIADSTEAIGELYSRWTELVDDDSDKPLDDRVGADSVAMHGQVAKPGAQFTMPNSARSIVLVNRYGKSRVSDDMIGESWAHPPNRPNDRSTVVPWRPGWDVDGWECVGGEKRPVRARRE